MFFGRGMRTALLVGASFMPIGAVGQQGMSPSVKELLAQLHSEQWTGRAAAYEKLRADSAALALPAVQRALIDLVDRENHVNDSVLRESHERVGVEDKFGEEYPEYVGELSDTVDTFADWADPKQVCIFVHEPYDPDSDFAAKIASHPKTSVPCLIQMLVDSDIGLMRAEAAPVLVHAMGEGTGQLDPAVLTEARSTLLKSLQNPEEVVRDQTVRAMAKYGGKDVIPALQRVAETDPAINPAAGKLHGYWIRKLAREAITAIENRVDGDCGR